MYILNNLVVEVFCITIAWKSNFKVKRVQGTLSPFLTYFWKFQKHVSTTENRTTIVLLT